ncbi:MAG: DUF86 domain-containing protein [Candidatus Altiarchaeales archaeon HGW-Altiarchaeales-2]|nr:MAG: DUF86 domain-containing protein [Candidatus Altiarchaeales archaeon HGW-Altiarchaeales-2]
MDNERKNRYGDKINFIIEKIESIPRTNFDDDIIKDAAFYKIQTAIECVSDMVAMLVRDIGKDVGDDYHNLEILKDENIIDEEIYEKLKKLNGLRNIIVHRYNKIEEDLIFNNLDEIRKNILNFIEIVEDVIQR